MATFDQDYRAIIVFEYNAPCIRTLLQYCSASRFENDIFRFATYLL